MAAAAVAALPGAASAGVFDGRLDGALSSNAAPSRTLRAADDVTLRRRGAVAQLVDRDTHAVVESAPAGGAPLVVEGSPGNDTLRIDFSGGNPAPGGVVFDGGAESGGTGDGLELAGGRFDNVTYTFAPDRPGEGHAGTVALRRGGETTRIEFRDLEPVTSIGTADAVFNLPVNGVDDQAILEDDADVGNGSSRLRSQNSTFETITFPNPTSSLTINLGDDPAERLDVAGLDPNSAPPITVNGGSGANILNLVTNGVSLNGGSFDGGGGTDRLAYDGYTNPVAANLGLSTTGLTATLTGDQEVPSQNAAASGSATLSSYDPDFKTVTVQVAVTGIAAADVTGFHIHKEASGQNGPIIVDLMPFGLNAEQNGFSFTALDVPIGAINESALLGGLTYLNVHTAAAPNGLIRGQVFSAGNVSLAAGTATGTGGVTSVESVSGGGGADGLLGSSATNAIGGFGGADFIRPGPGPDTLNAGGDGDRIAWSNGDGSDFIDSAEGSDIVQVNGSLTDSDVFTVNPNGSRINFDRTSPGPFNLNIGTTETLAVNGLLFDDQFEVNDLTGVDPVPTINLNGLDGFDTANLEDAASANINFRGGGGGNRLNGTNQPSTWNLTGPDRGSVTPVINSYESIANVEGGTAADVFAFQPGGSISGLLSGNPGAPGSGGPDTLDYSALSSPVSVNLGSNAPSYNATLGGDQEVPGNTSAASGSASVTYDPAARTIDLNGQVNGIAPADVTGFHIHREATGANGPIIVDLGTVVLTPQGDGFDFAASGLPLPAADEAALLGGMTYVNVHTSAAPNGLIRGQLFPSGLFAASPGRATGASGAVNIENVTGGAGADSLVGDTGVNDFDGGGGADLIVPSRSGDTAAGGGDNDRIMWSNGDGSDTMDGDGGSDLVQVNGSPNADPTGDDVFTVGASGARVDFDRTSSGPFSLNIGTTETLKVNGIAGDDSVAAGDLTGVADLNRLDFHGFHGQDALGYGVRAPGALSFDGGPQADSLTVNGTGGADQLSLAPAANGRASLARTNAPQSTLDFGTTEDLTVNMTAGSDLFTVKPLAGTTVTTNGGSEADTLRFDPGCLNVTTGAGSLTATGTQAVNHANYDTVDVASAFRIPIGAIPIAEGGGNAGIQVTRSAGGTGSASVDPVASGGSATAGADYSAPAKPLSFGPGETSKTASLPIVNDGAEEPDETVRVGLANPGPFANICSPSSSTVTIGDDDAPPPAGTPGAALRVSIVGKPKISTKDGSVTFLLNLTGPGLVSGKGVARVAVGSSQRRRTRRVTTVSGRKRARRAGRLRLKLKLTRRGKRLLRRKRRQRVAVTLTLKPTTGRSATAKRSVTLRLRRPRRG